MKKILVFDVGTTAMKCILFDESFNQLFYANKEYGISTPSESIAELNPQIYFDTFLECIEEIKNSGISLRDISSITFTTQGETLIPVDTNGKPLCDAIVWLDSRAEKEAVYLSEQLTDDKIYRNTGLYGIDGTLPAAKVLWLANNKPSIYERIHKILLLEDYLIFRLTGKYVSEKSLQSSTGWYDINNDTIFRDVSSLCGIKDGMLPDILPCATVVGTVKEEFGFGKGTVVTTGAMDQISSAVGVGNVHEGIFSETTGTALVVGITVENPEYDPNTPITVYKHYDNKFIYMPYHPTAGMSLKWFRDTIMPYAEAEAKKLGITSYEYIDKTASDSVAGSKGVLMLPNLSQSGGFIGITLATRISDMARSVLEGVAYKLREFIELATQKNIEIHDIYSLGGGSKSAIWCQIKADVCKKNIIPVSFSETTALGAAILASVALGIYKSVNDAIERCNITGKVITPNTESYKIYDECYNKYKKFTLED